MKNLLIALVSVLCATNLMAQTRIQRDTTLVGVTWKRDQSPYIVGANIRVAGTGLKIEPGVTILFDGNYIFEVTGKLMAVGTEQDSIVFTKNAGSSGWKGIFFNISLPGSELEYCRIEGSTNRGIYIDGSTPIIRNCTIRNNSISGLNNISGGEIYTNTPLTILNCIISNNTVTANGSGTNGGFSSGGGIFASAPLILKDCTVSNNTATTTSVGYTPYGQGGGIYTTDKLTLMNCVISKNTISISITAGPSNSVAEGGGIYAGGELNISNSMISQNSSFAPGRGSSSLDHGNSRGGGIYAGTSNLTNCIISQNSATANGVGPVMLGGGIYINAGNSAITNCTIAYNTNEGLRRDGGTVKAINSIIFSNTGEQISGNVTVTFSDIQGGYPGEGNIKIDPSFSKPPTDLKIVDGSPCMDTGDPAPQYNDLCFSPPSLGTTRNDMGAYGGPGACEWLTLKSPQNLKARAGDRQVTLIWDVNKESNFLRYRIYSGTSPTLIAKMDSVEGVANTTKTITGLTNGTTYYFRITAVNSVLQESGFSNEVSASPPANRPPVVLNSISNQTITLGVSSFTRNLNASPPIFNDPEGQTLNYSASSNATNIATPSVSGSTLTVTPVAAGSATITVTANDGDDGTASTMFSITVNRRPVVASAIPDLVLQFGGASFTRDLNASPAVFSDPDNGDVLAYTTSSSDTNKAKVRLSGSVLTINPAAGGSANIIVTASDGKGGTIADTFKVTVNRPPVRANPIADQNLTLGGAAFTRNLNASPAVFSDPDGDALTYISSSSDTNKAKARLSGTTLTVTAADTGSATITVTANDGKSGTASTTFTARVRPGNRQPTVANPIPNQTLAIGGAAFVRNLNSSPVVFSDLDGDVLTYATSSSVPAVATAGISSGSTLTVTPVALGSTKITVTANDGGNGSVSTEFTVTVNQLSVPQIIHSPVLLAPSGRSQPISATLTDNNGIQSALLYYRMGGTLTYASLAMTKLSGDVYQGVIPAGVVTERGFAYYFSVENTVTIKATFPATNPEDMPQLVQVNNSNFVFSTPTRAKAYRMISIPFDLNDKSPASVLGDDFGGTYDDKQWRLLKYLNGTNVEFGNPNFANFEPGTGFWLITREAKILDAGAGKNVTIAQNYVITLPTGWSQIGNPFAFTVNWSDVVKGVNVEDKLVGYQGSNNDTTGYDYERTQLVPFEGYFVNNKGSSPTTIGIPPKAASSAAAKPAAADWKSALQGSEWALQITATCDRYLDKDNYLGCLNDASDEWDANDFSEAPFFDQHVALYFPHLEWKKYPDLYTGDFRETKAEGDYWDFFVKSEVAKSEVARSEVVLKLAEVQNLPVDWEVVLLDKASRIAVNFSEKKQYTFLSGNGKTVREFRIVVGKKDFVETNDLNLSGVPQEFKLSQNYPNPFYAASGDQQQATGNHQPGTRIDYELPFTNHVKISVYNVSGQLVRTLFDGEQSVGRYTVSWDGANSFGERVASGVYLVQMMAGDPSTRSGQRFVAVRKAALAK